MFNSKRLRNAIIAVSLFLFSFAAVAVEAKSDKLLAMTPAESLFCIRVNNLDYTLGQIDQFLTGISPVPLATSAMVRMHLAQVLGSPELNGVNMSGNFAIFGTLNAGEKVDHGFISALIPVTDYQKLVGQNPNITQPDANGVSKTKSGPILIQVGDFALLKWQKSYDKLVATAKSLSTGRARGLADILDSGEAKQATTEPIWTYGNVQLASKFFGPMLFARIQEIKKMMETMKAGGKGPMGNPAAIMNMYAEILKTLMKETKSLSLTIGPKPSVCNLNIGISAVPDSNMAKMFVSDASAERENKLLSYLKDGAVMNFGYKMNTPFFRQFNVKRIDIVKALAGESVTADDITEMKKLATDALDCFGNSAAFSFSVDAANKPPFKISFVIEMKNAEMFNKVIEEAAKMMNTGGIADFYKSLGIEMRFELKRAVDTYKEISIDSAKLVMRSTDPNLPQGQIMNAMFGDGFNYRWAVADGLWICAVSGDPDSAIRRLIDEVKAGGPKQVSGEMKAALELLPQASKADCAGTFNFLRYFGIITAFMPIPLPKMDIMTKSDIAFAGRTGDGKMTVDVALPKEHLMEISSFFQKMQQQQKQNQQRKGDEATTKAGVSVQIKEIAWPSTPRERFTTFKKAPRGTFCAWFNKGYTLGWEEFIQPKDSSFLELLVLFKNSGRENCLVKADDLKLEYSGVSSSPWEVLQVGVFEDYEYLENRFGLSLDEPNKVRRLCQEGAECTLEPGKETWAIFIYQVPNDLKKAQLTLGEDLHLRIEKTAS